MIMNTIYQTNRFLFFTLLFSALAFAQEEEFSISFTRHVIFKPADGGNSAVVADINEDEKPDVVSSSSMDDTIRWYKNLGEGVFTDEQGNYTDNTIFDNADHAWSVAVGDIDGDEDIDVVSASAIDNTIRWYENHRDVDGNVVFTDYTIFSSAMGARSVAVADIDGDNDLDVLSASVSDNSIRWFENTGIDLDSDGGIGFTEHIIFANALSARAVAVADLDDDDDLDVLSASFTDASVRWYENKGREDGVNEGSVNFTTHLIYKNLEDLGQPTFVATADLNNDDKLDVLSSSFAFVRWYENDGSENFTNRGIANQAASGFSFLTSADIDGDTDIDVVAVAGSGSSILWYESNAASLNVEKVLPQTTVLYPNPTSSEVYLNYATATNTTYGLFDVAGKRLAKFTQSGTAHQLDVSSVSKGTYILKATSGLQVNYYRIVKE